MYPNGVCGRLPSGIRLHVSVQQRFRLVVSGLAANDFQKDIYVRHMADLETRLNDWLGRSRTKFILRISLLVLQPVWTQGYEVRRNVHISNYL